MHKITLIKNTDFDKLKLLSNVDLCVSFNKNFTGYCEYLHLLNQVKPIAILKEGISDKKNNMFRILDNFILLNKSAVKNITHTYELYKENSNKKWNNKSLENYFKTPDTLNPRVLMYNLLLISETFIWIKPIHKNQKL
tara:strand:+ start:1612 stop:2025 length:414 start_codon:yes stop_codon:yes gene_type:complete